MSAIVVQDDMDRHLARGAALNPLQKTHKLLMTVTRHAVAQHLAAQAIQRGQQRRGSEARIIVGLALGKSRTPGQNRLRTIQGLDPALLIDAQHPGFFGGIQVPTYNAVRPGKEPGIEAELEALDPMRLQAMRLPDAIHRRRTHPRWVRASVRTVQNVAPVGLLYSVAFTMASSFSAVSRRLRPARAASSSSPSSPLLLKPATPTQPRRKAGAQFPCRPVVRRAIGRTQHNADAKYDLWRRTSRPRQAFERFSLFLAETQRFGSFPHGAHYTASHLHRNVIYATLP
jgi:hypothetical protein